ncbi:MAG: hypothetical protein ABJI96_06535 [Paracoccaceae bacterium]
MRVARNTPEQLIISDTPWFMGIMLALFIFIFVAIGLLLILHDPLFGFFWMSFGASIGIAAFALLVRRTQVILDGPSNSIKFRNQSVFRYQSIEHQLDELGHAVLETAPREATKIATNSAMTRAVLVFPQGMSAGRHPIVRAYRTGRKPQRIVEAVNIWHQALLDSNGRGA